MNRLCVPAIGIVCAGLMLCGSAGAAPTSAASTSTPPDRPTTAGSLSGATGAASAPSPARCAVLRKRYLDSQACFNRYRLVDHGLAPEAFKHCRNVVDPSPVCGPDLPTK